MTDFSHLHALELRLEKEREQLAKANGAEKRLFSVWVAQTEKEIADERTFLNLNEDLSVDDLYDELADTEHRTENPDWIAY